MALQIGSTGGIVDAHHHLWDIGRTPQPWIDPVAMAALHRSYAPADLRAALAGSGVGATVVVQSVPSPGETIELLALAARERLLAGVVGWVDLEAPDVADRLTALLAAPGGRALVGIRHLVQDEDETWLDRPAVRRGLVAVGDAGLAYDLLVHPRHLPSAVRAARAVPGTRFVLDHLGKPPVGGGVPQAWAAGVRALAAVEGTAVKLSGLATQAAPGALVGPEDLRPYTDVVLGAFGAERTMFGSDWPVCLLATGYDRWVGTVRGLLAELSGTERERVLGGTARAFYRLPADPLPADPLPAEPSPGSASGP